jgi:hypothetical protein
MHMTFQRNGVRGEAIILSVTRDRMRIAERGCGDTSELALADGHWRDERGREIEIEAMVAAKKDAFADFRPRTFTAGSLL